MADRMLIGFAGELEGNEARLVAAEPVFRVNNEIHVARGRRWHEQETVRVSSQDLEYVHRLPEEVPVRPGQIVWLAGRSFVSRVQSFSALRDLAIELTSTWRVASRGVRWTIGTATELDRLYARASQALEVQLHNCLFDQLEKSMGDSAQTLEFYLAMTPYDSIRRYQNMGLYYLETRQQSKYQLTSTRAVSAGVISTDEAFDAAVRYLRDWLVQERLSERNGQSGLTAVAQSWRSRPFALRIGDSYYYERVAKLAEWHRNVVTPGRMLEETEILRPWPDPRTTDSAEGGHLWATIER